MTLLYENGDYKQFIPHFWLVKLDETKNWREDIQKAAGKLYGIYLFDESEYTYLCEMQPSYFCYFIETTTENEVSDEVAEDISWGNAMMGSDNDDYFHVREIDNQPNEAKVDLGEWLPEDEDETYESIFERVREYVTCNQLLS